MGIRCAFSHGSEDEVIRSYTPTTKVADEDEDVDEDEQKHQGPGDAQQGEETMRKWHIGAGGAITVLSDEEAEWEEMSAKMGSVLKGFGVMQ